MAPAASGRRRGQQSMCSWTLLCTVVLLGYVGVVAVWFFSIHASNSKEPIEHRSVSMPSVHLNLAKEPQHVSIPLPPPNPPAAATLRGNRDPSRADQSHHEVINRLNDQPQRGESQPVAAKGEPSVSDIDSVANWLTTLAMRPTDDLMKALNSSVGDIFEIQALQEGVCPTHAVPWIPMRPAQSTVKDFKAHHGETMVWYEHLSKAGGTSFCKLARKNMPKAEVPQYYCMPSEPGMVDARVGQWTNEKLIKYSSEHEHRLVSNEWEPFPLERLELQSTEQASEDSLRLLFVSNVREPLNRLLSAFRFWGVLHNPASTKPPFSRWARNMELRAANDEKSPRGMGKGVGTGKDFIAQVGRPNFACWKFSGGSMPIDWQKDQSKAANQFKVAVRTASRFDLVIPMEHLTAHPEPLTDVLGWTNFQDTHVVPSGKIVNNDAATELAQDEYRSLWEKNKFDMVLYTWLRALYLIRINCGL